MMLGDGNEHVLFVHHALYRIIVACKLAFCDKGDHGRSNGARFMRMDALNRQTKGVGKYLTGKVAL